MALIIERETALHGDESGKGTGEGAAEQDKFDSYRLHFYSNPLTWLWLQGAERGGNITPLLIETIYIN